MLLVDNFRDAPDCFWSTLQCFRKRPRLPNTISAVPTGPDPIQTIEVFLPQAAKSARPKPVRITWDFTTQHTLKWDEPITALLYDDTLKCEVATTLAPGSCNLYTYPKVVWSKPAAPRGKGLGALISSAVAANKKGFEVLEGAYLELLKSIFLAIANSPTERDVLKLPDSSGANSVLGMLVANTDAAIDVCMAIYRAWPSMIATPHLPGFFVGENAFHVLAANSQETALCELIQMAYDLLPRKDVKECFTSQCMGLFFTGPPMYQYGGTPMGYAASFCCRKAIALYLSLAYTDKVRGFIDLNDSSNLCVYSGFSPLHAVVCNGYKSMYDFLADLPDVRPATPAHAAMSPTTPQPHTTSHMPPATHAFQIGMPPPPWLASHPPPPTSNAVERSCEPSAPAARFHVPPPATCHRPPRATAQHVPPPITCHRPPRATARHVPPPATCHRPARATARRVPPPTTCHRPPPIMRCRSSDSKKR